MKWYDVFAKFYDSTLENLYSEGRKKAAEFLDLNDATTVLDVACGTGANFKHLKLENQHLKIYGTDYSSGMLTKAKSLITKNNWSEILLFRTDARNLKKESIRNYTNSVAGFDRIICSLGLSTIPEWEMVLDNLIDLLNPNGKIVIMDVYAEKRNISSWVVEKIAKANLNRKIWQTLETKTENFRKEYLSINELKIGGKLFVAQGTKKTEMVCH